MAFSQVSIPTRFAFKNNKKARLDILPVAAIRAEHSELLEKMAREDVGFGLVLRRYLTWIGMTPGDFRRRLPSASASAVKSWLGGQCPPGAKTFYRIANDVITPALVEIWLAEYHHEVDAARPRSIQKLLFQLFAPSEHPYEQQEMRRLTKYVLPRILSADDDLGLTAAERLDNAMALVILELTEGLHQAWMLAATKRLDARDCRQYKLWEAVFDDLEGCVTLPDEVGALLPTRNVLLDPRADSSFNVELFVRSTTLSRQPRAIVRFEGALRLADQLGLSPRSGSDRMLHLEATGPYKCLRSERRVHDWAIVSIKDVELLYVSAPPRATRRSGNRGAKGKGLGDAIEIV